MVEAVDEEIPYYFTAEDSYIVKEEFAKWYPTIKKSKQFIYRFIVLIMYQMMIMMANLMKHRNGMILIQNVNQKETIL